MFEMLGAAGIAISALAYLPQVIHLAKEHCSAGISGRAWAMWLTSSMLVGALAVHRKDIVFIVLQPAPSPPRPSACSSRIGTAGWCVRHTLTSPPTARPETSRVTVKLHPGHPSD
jgi:uncharacterized protein with PQ loop repeat